MALQTEIIQGSLVWCGEHWVNYIRKEGTEEASGMFSLYHTVYSPCGVGNVAYVIVRMPQEKLECICTDNRCLVDFIKDEMIKGKVSHFDRDFQIVDAIFSRRQEFLNAPSWDISTEKFNVSSIWRNPDPAISLYRPDYCIFSNLFYTYDTEIRLNGNRVEGMPYPRGGRSSGVFALGETIIRLKPQL